MVKLFNGDSDSIAWLAKVKLVARLLKVPDLVSFIPLFLEGNALALYLRLSNEDQLDADKTEAKLKVMFTEEAFSAYSKLERMRWASEAVDVYASNIQSKVKLATVVEDDQKAPFSIATTPKCRGGHYSFPWIAPLYL